MPLQATSGAASYDAFGGGVAAVPNYIEDVFSTWLYTGNGGTQTITNGIDLAGKGGLVWLKRRDNTSSHVLVDSQRGISKFLRTNSIDAESTSTTNITAFNADGFSLGTGTNVNGGTYVSWTFREQPKFFDVVTYTGDGSSSQVIAHNLTSPPGCIIIKATSTTADWVVYARYDEIDPTTPLYKDLRLNTTAASTQNVGIAGATSFTVGGLGDPVNTNGVQYVAYLFAHNAGGFGLTGTDNVISCGGFTTDATTGKATVNLGYEPQFILTKMADGLSDWTIFDSMRGMSLTNSYELFPNSSSSEVNYGSPDIFPSATGFSVDYVSGSGQFGKNKTIIYIAIRRGPMKVPTSGTSVFAPVAFTGDGTANRIITTGFNPDNVLYTYRNQSWGHFNSNRLTNRWLQTESTAAEFSDTTQKFFQVNNGVNINDWNDGSQAIILHAFGRAPGFFDEVCYTGNVTTRDIPHNLGVAPELVIGKRRSGAEAWYVWCAYAPDSSSATFAAQLNSGVRYLNWGSGLWGNFGGSVNMNATTYSIGSGSELNQNASTNVTYLFATCPGVSKVGSYTGTGTTQQINCGFTAGARFVLIKRVDGTGFGSVGDWYVWDSARGIVAGNDPYLLLNSTAAEVTSTDYVDTYSAGFEISSTAPAAINASGGTFIFLAIA